MSKPLVAIVGRPNVGKSTLFNKIIGQRLSIVEDTPGVTRDRIYGEAEWCGRTFSLIDTGGIEPKTDDLILRRMREQAQIAIDTADVIIFVCDVRAGVTADDRDIAVMLSRSGKPIIPCVNKIDGTGELPYAYYEFYELGLKEDPIPLSSAHGTGTGDLLDRVVSYFPADEGEEADDDVIRVAVIGKPNAGKSSIINRILGTDRLIVSNIPGTTRDAIDTYIENEYGKFCLIDTAGIRRSSRIDDSIEKYAVLRAHMAVERADVCLLMVDAVTGITEQDEHIAGIAHEAGKASIICMNKWDAVEKDSSTTNAVTRRVRDALSYMPYAPIRFVSAMTGQRVDTLFELISCVYAESRKRVSTGVLNDLLADAVARNQVPSDKGKRLKLYYMTQSQVAPPTFVVFCNSAELFHFSYQRYLENCIREAFGFSGTPIRLVIRQKGDKED